MCKKRTRFSRCSRKKNAREHKETPRDIRERETTERWLVSRGRANSRATAIASLRRYTHIHTRAAIKQERANGKHSAAASPTLLNQPAHTRTHTYIHFEFTTPNYTAASALVCPGLWSTCSGERLSRSCFPKAFQRARACVLEILK